MQRHIHLRNILTVAIALCLTIAMPSAVYAAPAEGSTVQYSGTSGTVTWEIYTDGTMVLRPTSGNEGTMRSFGGAANGAPWYSKKTSIKKVETQGTIHAAEDISCMFYTCTNITSIDLSNFDTSDVTDMSSMFYGCSNLASVNISSFNTKNVTDMGQMFYGCRALTSLDVSGFNTGSVTTMHNMFYNCEKLTSLDVSGFNTKNVVKMNMMFGGCTKLTSLDVSGFNTENVTNMSQMFYKCSGLTSLNIRGFNTGNVTNMSSMFYECSKITSLDVSGFNTGSAKNMSSMFYRCSGLKSLNVSGFNTENVTNMSSMFYGCSGLTSLNVSGFNTGNVKNMSSMFCLCGKLASLDVSGFDTGEVTNMSAMFNSCSKLTAVNVRGINTEKVTNMSNMFSGCSELTSIDVSMFDTGSATNMSNMFARCPKLAHLDVSGFDTRKVTNMSYMFSECSALAVLDVSGFDTGKVTDMSNMFLKCYKIASLDLGNFDTGNVTNMDSMFIGNSNLSEVVLGENFSFKGKNITADEKQALLPTPPSATTTGKWIKEDGTIEAKTPAELRDQYDVNASAWAGKWVWEEKPTTYTVQFTAPDGFAGSMPDQKIKAAEAGTLNTNTFSRFDYTFDHWDGSDGRTYTDGQTIPANRFRVGDTLTLTAAFTKNQHFLNFTGGVAEFILKAGEKAVFSGLPGGTSYRVWEETPSGWQLVKQENPTGTIPANGTAEAGFYNEYVPGTATVTLMATKTIDGRLPEAGAFEFELLDSNGTVIGTASNDGTGLVTFDAITFTEPGTYVYSIREVRGEDGGISYDPHTEVITVSVEDDGQGNLIATSSSMNTLPSFENETKPGMLRLRKHTEGGLGDEVFTFEIELTNENGMPLDSVQITGEAAG